MLSLLLLIGIPIIFYVWSSVWSEPPGLGGTFTLEGYVELFTPKVYNALSNTLIFTVVGTASALIIGIVALLFGIKVDFPGRRIIPLLLILQYLLPAYLVGLAWEFYAGANGPLNQALMVLPFVDSPVVDPNSILVMSFIAGAHYAGVVYLLSSAAVQSVPRAIEEAGLINGARTSTIFNRITLRLALPSLVMAGIIVFTRLSQSFGLPLILGLPNRIFVLSTLMYVNLTQYPPNFTFGAAIGMIILILTLIALAAQRWSVGDRAKFQTIGSEGTDGLTLSMGRYQNYVMWGFIAFLIVVYVLPLLVMLVSSFQRSFVGLDIGAATWTVEHYRSILVGSRSQYFREAISNSLVVAGFGAFVAMVLATAASFIIIKGSPDSWTGGFLDFLTLSPIAIPSIVVGTAFLWLFLSYNPLGLYGTVWLIILGLTAKFIVYGTRAANSAFRAISDELEEAAQLSGAGLRKILQKIYLPLIKGGFAAGYTILFVDFLKVLTIPLFLSGAKGNTVISVIIWFELQGGNYQAASTYASILMVMIVAAYTAVFYFTDIDITRI